MSRFYGEIRGDRARKSATRCGHRGLSSHTRGWNAGVAVELESNADGPDTVRAYLTGGSQYPGSKRLILETDVDSACRAARGHGFLTQCRVSGDEGGVV